MPISEKEKRKEHLMEVSKVFLYCAKAKPFLTKEKSGIFSLFKDEKEVREDWEIYTEIAAYGKHNSLEYDEYFDKYILNGSVCFECDCKEAFGIFTDVPSFCQFSHDRLTKDAIEKFKKRSCLKWWEICSYGNGKMVWGYHFDNIKPIDPMPINQLYKDEACTIPLTRAPQSYCFAYRKIETTREDWYSYLASLRKNDDKNRRKHYLVDNGRFFYIEKVLVFSIRSNWLALEVNIDQKTGKPYKDLEVRKTRIANAGIEYK
jgi:hypothetical protein